MTIQQLINKRCSCGHGFSKIPNDATEESGMYWFNCPMCNSTLVIKKIQNKAKVVEEKRREDNQNLIQRLDLKQSTRKGKKL